MFLGMRDNPPLEVTISSVVPVGTSKLTLHDYSHSLLNNQMCKDPFFFVFFLAQLITVGFASPGAMTRENQICTTHSTEKVSQQIIVDQYLLFNVRYYVVSDCGITHEIQSRIYCNRSFHQRVSLPTTSLPTTSLPTYEVDSPMLNVSLPTRLNYRIYRANFCPYMHG